MKVLSWLERPSKQHSSQTAQVVWLAFAAFALSLAIPGIPRYFALLQTPCDGAACFETQLTFEAARAWPTSGQTLENNARTQLMMLLLTDGLLFITAAFLIWRKLNNRASVLA